VECVSDVWKAPRSFANLGTACPMTHCRRYERHRCENLAFPTNLEDTNVKRLGGSGQSHYPDALPCLMTPATD